MNCIVVGVDGSASAAAALQWAGTLADRVGAEIVAVSAFPAPASEMRPEDHQQMLEERERLMADTWARPAADVGASVRVAVRGGDPRNVVLEVADDEEADLVVLGRTGRGGGPGFFHLGSVVEHAAHHTHRPLAVVPTMASGPIERIVVGVDGSPASSSAVEWCTGLAQVTDATVVAVSVEEPFLEWTPSTSPDNWRRDLERSIDEWVAPARAEGVTVEHVAQRDLHPADGLLAVASARGGDILVVGTRGTGGFLGLRAGGVAMKVLHRASLPVVLVPPGD